MSKKLNSLEDLAHIKFDSLAPDPNTYNIESINQRKPVSYTHLTLPTSIQV